MRWFLFIFIVSCAVVLRADEVNFLNSYKAAREVARKENKMMMVDVYTDWCGWCKVLDKTTYKDSAVVSLLKDKFISVKLNAEKSGEGYDFGTRYCIQGYPNILFINPEGRLVHLTNGYMEPKPFYSELMSVLEKAERNFYYHGFGTEQPVLPEFYYQYFTNDTHKRVHVSYDIKNSWLEDKDLREEPAFLMLKCFGVLGHAERFKEVVSELYNLYPESDVAEIAYSYISETLNSDDSAGIEHRLPMADALIEALAPADKGTRMVWKFSLYSGVYKNKGNWESYWRLFDELYNSGIKNTAYYGNEVCWTLYENCDDEQILRKAAARMAEVTAEVPDFNYIDTYAALLFKTRQYSEAETQARRAIEIGKANGLKTTDTEELLRRILEASGSPDLKHR